jgi:hypothetical protein
VHLFTFLSERKLFVKCHLRQGFSARGPPMCFVRPAYIFYNMPTVSVCMIKNISLRSEKVVLIPSVRDNKYRHGLRLDEERQIKN